MLWQDSVPRLKHVSALSCLHALQANSQDIPCRFAELESQSFIASEQLQKAAVEAAEMRSQMSEMVPRSELAAAMEECETWKALVDEHARAVEDLGRRLESAESAKAQIESQAKVGPSHRQLKLSNRSGLDGTDSGSAGFVFLLMNSICSPQEMVPRFELLSVSSELEKLRSHSAPLDSKVSSLEAEVAQGRTDLSRAQAEAAEMRSALSAMVPRSEVAAAIAECEALRAERASARKEHAQAVRELQKQLMALESEKTGLLVGMQVSSASG